MNSKFFEERLHAHGTRFSRVVPFNETDGLLKMDFTAANKELDPETLADTAAFTAYVEDLLEKNNAKYGIGGYGEHRTIYSRSAIFDSQDEPRRFHLGVDIWGDAGTPVFAPLAGSVHSFCFNKAFGDYGATLVLEHQLTGLHFYSLYGHLSLASIENKKPGESVEAGAEIASFGVPEENGNWPPHLHFQLILDMEGFYGDYPGVCKYSLRDRYLENCPDPDLILKMLQYATAPTLR
jgi:peptidoglycan LD-endopeptidase LytH